MELETVTPRRKPGPAKRPSRLVETAVMLHADDLAALDALVQQEGRSRSCLIREAIRKTWRPRKGA
jgi:metal-responsive CopG/Arc/MetJ family transcriptional regulator